MSKKPPVPVVTDLTLKIVNNLKTVSPPLFTEVTKALQKYQQAVEELSKQGGVLADALYKIGASHSGDLGEGLRKCAEFIKDSETKREDVASVLLQAVIVPLKANADTEMKEALAYEKNYKKDRDQMRQDIMKLEARTKKAGKKITPEQLKQQISELNDKVKEAETMKSNKFREAIILERKKYATLLSLLNTFMAKELEIQNDYINKHKVNETMWATLAASVTQIPKEFEEMIQKQERTYVQIQAQASDADNYRISYAPNALNTSSSNLNASYSYEYGNYDSYDSYDGTSYDAPSSPTSYSYAGGDASYGASAGGGSQARALYDYAGDQATDLSFSAGDIITIVQDDDGSGWTKGQDSNGNEGIFPTSYIEYL
eukprot:Phypoly_transcript_10615.p1 GENE.Phypoly_transcript_10615~~Phypoly_transcript_10615.p1  ORF type:complete len:373 (+),score=89.06 Phypoly_transcript_10615:148-1266(+)